MLVLLRDKACVKERGEQEEEEVLRREDDMKIAKVHVIYILFHLLPPIPMSILFLYLSSIPCILTIIISLVLLSSFGTTEPGLGFMRRTNDEMERSNIFLSYPILPFLSTFDISSLSSFKMIEQKFFPYFLGGDIIRM